MITKPLIIIAMTGLLAACEMDNAAESSPQELPGAEVIRSVAANSYMSIGAVNATNLQVGNIQLTSVFIGLPPDYLVCVTTTEAFTENWYNNAGQVTKRVGDPFRQSWVMLMREYPQGWGSGVFRRVESGKIGHVRMLDVCPPSQH